MSILIKNISKYYGKKRALENISFEIKKGEIVGLLGTNGAGKSTLIKIISCYLEQDKGSIFVSNLDTSKDQISIKKKIGYLPENNYLYSEMYVTEYLYFICELFSIKDKINSTLKIIEKTGLTTEKHKKIKMLSKGYRQRVGIAAALIHDPEILILDEPTTGLDPKQLLEIRSLIKKIGKNKTVILSTHIMQEVDKMCNRIIIINNGEIIDDQQISFLRKKNIDLENYFISLTK